ncbi:MAG: 1-acyl-sn-glycerol-3-phosphate acyltransferase [Acidobacteriota bacterium]|nr:1-acyl-sn-glycerol-3-phosphate acyltransferase [Acidobacteriota bacterium]MDH3784734.1 1-acyl-sn-glycerol-3-phosphate acyltransferase [Acidobacteriota bacterium]
MKHLLRNLPLWLFHFGFGRPVLRWVAGVHYRRRNLVPRGPCVVVANHNSHLDAALLMGLFPLRRLPFVHPIAAADYFGKTWFKRTMAMLMMNAIPIERKAAKGQDPMLPMADALRAGKSLILFPEGSRGEAGVMARFRPGIGRLAQLAPGTLIVPVFLSGPERIWGRGTLLPVPQAVDVVVGKPRTYDPELDARDIAAQVQRDVVALAPPEPPPPSPQPRPARSVAVCGVDDALRHRVVRAITRSLGEQGTTLGLTQPTLTADQDGVREITAPVPPFRGQVWLRPVAGLLRGGPRFIEMIERAQIDEAAHRAQDVRYVVSDGNALVDLVAWAESDIYQGEFDEAGLHRLTQYLRGELRIPLSRKWRSIRRTPAVWLVNQFDLARPPVPEVLVFLTTRPAELTARRRSSGEETDPSHDEAFFERLHEGYRRVGHVMGRRRKVVWLEFDETALLGDDLTTVVDAVGAAINEPAPELESNSTH